MNVFFLVCLHVFDSFFRFLARFLALDRRTGGGSGVGGGGGERGGGGGGGRGGGGRGGGREIQIKIKTNIGHI